MKREPLPARLEAERSALGILLLGEEESWDEVASLITAGDFFQPAHKTVFTHIRELRQKGQPTDVVTVGNALKKSGALDQVGGAPYLSDLIHDIPSTANIRAYAEIIKEKSILRQAIRKSESFIQKAQKEDYDKIEHFLDHLESEIFQLGESRSGSDPVKVGSLVESGLKKLEDLYHKKTSITGLPSSFHELDTLTSGFQNSELIVIAARPSMGKTALSLNIALHSALNKKTAAFFSLEMSREQVALRLLSSMSQINLSQLITGQVKDHSWGDLISAAARLSESELYIDDSSPLSPYEIRSKARRLKARHGLDLVIVDYLQLMKLTEKTESREREVSEMSRLLKSFAKELNIPVIALSQLNRGVEGRTNKRPLLSDLRESGAIEQDADVIMMLYRGDYYENEEKTGLAEVIVSKQRNGPTGTVKLRWMPEYGAFENNIPEEEAGEPPPLSPEGPPPGKLLF